MSGNSTAGVLADGGGIYAQTSTTLTNSLVLGNVAAQAADNDISGIHPLQGGNVAGYHRLVAAKIGHVPAKRSLWRLDSPSAPHNTTRTDGEA